MKVPSLKRWGMVDTAICLLVVVLIIWLIHRINTELSYRWDWMAPLTYLITRTESGWSSGLLLEGILMSLRLMCFGGIVAVLIGGGLAALALSPITAMRVLSRLYVESLRHLPPIVFMFIFFYFISSQFFNTEATQNWLQEWDGFWVQLLFGGAERSGNLLSGLFCLALFEAAFICEIIRAGVLSIEAGQWEAARSIGLSRWQTLRWIILPQVRTRIAAPLTGQLILLVKDSSILSVISVQELTFTAQETAVSTQQVFETWMVAAFFYFMICWPLLILSRRWEHHSDKQ